MTTQWQDIDGEILASAVLHSKENLADELGSRLIQFQRYIKEHEPGTREFSFARHGNIFITWERFVNGDALIAHVSSKEFENLAKAALTDDEKTPAPLFYKHLSSHYYGASQ